MTSVSTYILTITSVTTNINKLVYHVSTKMVKTIMFGKHIQTNTVQDNIPHTASNVCVLGSVTCSHTQEEAVSLAVVQAHVIYRN